MRLWKMHLIDFPARPWLFLTGNIIFIASHFHQERFFSTIFCRCQSSPDYDLWGGTVDDKINL